MEGKDRECLNEWLTVQKLRIIVRLAMIKERLECRIPRLIYVPRNDLRVFSIPCCIDSATHLVSGRRRDRRRVVVGRSRVEAITEICLMIGSGFESSFPLAVPDSHLRDSWGGDDGNRALRTQVASSIHFAPEQNICTASFVINVIVQRPLLGAGLVVDWNVECANKEANNVAVVSKRSRCCKEDPEMKQSDEPI